MSDDMLDPTCIETPETSIRPDLLVSAVLNLMSNYSANSGAITVTNNAAQHDCPGLALMIERHLTTLASLPTLAPVLQATCQQLAEQWEAVDKRTLPKPEKITGISTLSDQAKGLSGLTPATRGDIVKTFHLLSRHSLKIGYVVLNCWRCPDYSIRPE